MKYAKISLVRIEPALRQEMAQTSERNEDLGDEVETAVRVDATRRHVRTEFMQRGLASIRKCVVEDSGIPASNVIAKLEAKLKGASRPSSAEDF